MNQPMSQTFKELCTDLLGAGIKVWFGWHRLNYLSISMDWACDGI